AKSFRVSPLKCVCRPQGGQTIRMAPAVKIFIMSGNIPTPAGPSEGWRQQCPVRPVTVIRSFPAYSGLSAKIDARRKKRLDAGFYGYNPITVVTLARCRIYNRKKVVSAGG